MTSEELKDPKARLAWLEQQGIEGFFLVSGEELQRIQEGGQLLNAEITRWKRIMQQAYRTQDPRAVVGAIHEHKQQFKKCENQRVRYRHALIDVIQKTPVGPHHDIARKGLEESE